MSPVSQRFPRSRTRWLLAALFLTACAGFARDAHALQGPPPAPVRVDAVREELLGEKRTVTGNLRALQDSAVASEESGRVVELLVREGYAVEAGALLARLDDKRLELELATLRAEVQVAGANLAERESERELAVRDLAALEALAARDAANPKELADARTGLGRADARLEQSRQLLEVLAARRALLAARLEDMQIRAPFAGTVVRLHTEVGQWLLAGGPVAQLVSTRELEAWIEVPQRDFAAVLAQSGPILVRIDATGAEFSLEDYRPIQVVDQSARTFRVVGRVPDAAALAPGMSLTAEIPTSNSAQHLTVGHDGILRNEVGPYVYIAMPGGEGEPHQALPVQVEILFRTRERVVVRSPRLMAGALVIVEGNERLYPTAPVLPRPQQGGSAQGVGQGTGR